MLRFHISTVTLYVRLKRWNARLLSEHVEALGLTWMDGCSKASLTLVRD